MADFAGKVVWVTGASSGIGEAVARRFAAEGASVILSGRRLEALQAVAEQLQGDSLVLPFEVTDYDNLQDQVDAAWAWRDRVDILVNNAGISQRSLAIHTAPEVYQQLINVDLLAPIWLTQLQLNRMREAGGGHIVAVSSLAGRIGSPLRTAYSAAKHGLIGYMDALRTEVSARHNIQITNVLPGSVATDIARNAMIGDGSSRGTSDENIDNGDDPMDCAAAILQAVKNNEPELIFAGGMELEIAKLRHSDPQQTFDILSQLGTGIAEKMEAGIDASH